MDHTNGLWICCSTYTIVTASQFSDLQVLPWPFYEGKSHVKRCFNRGQELLPWNTDQITYQQYFYIDVLTAALLISFQLVYKSTKNICCVKLVPIKNENRRCVKVGPHI